MKIRGVPQLAELLDVSEEWVRRQCRAGRFPHLRVGGRLRFTETDVAEILAALAVPAAVTAAPPAEPAAGRTARRRYAVYPVPD